MSPAIGLIRPNSTPAIIGPVVSSISSETQIEGTSLVHTVTLASAVVTLPADYVFSLSNVTASTPSDYSAAPTFSNSVTRSGGVVTVPVGVTTFTITVPTSQDTIYEGQETYSVSVGGITATGTISDDDAAPTILSVSGASVTEGAPVVHAVAITGLAEAARTFAISLVDVTAVGGLDYTAVLTNAAFSNGVTISGGNVSVPGGVTGFTVSVPTTDDALEESTETYTLTIGGASGTGTIVDNDALPTPSYYLNFSNPANATLASSQARGTITNSMASYVLNLFNPVNATISDTQARGTITGAVGGSPTWTATFGTTLATDPVTISAATTVRLDGNHIAQSIDVLGTLIIPVNMSTSLTTGYINVGANGALITDGTLPPQYTHTVTLNGAEQARTARTVSGTSLGFTNNGVGRSLQVQPGGKLNLFGTSPTVKRTKLNAHAAASTNTFTLADSTGWLAGDEIVIGTTDFYGVSVPEKLTLQSNASGTTVQTTTTIASARWGVMQYVTDTGMSLTAGMLTGAPVGTPTTLDERAMVINLTRNIIIQGANDTAWTTSKFGAHCMFMGRTSDIKLDGVQFRRVGQAGAIGRYPIHWHMMSYDMSAGMNVPSPTGTFLGAVVGSHYAKNCSVSESGQRMIVIHGTHGVTLDANVGFDITGHAIFLEDGAEQDNVITNNVVMKVRSPTTTNRLLLTDTATGVAYGYAGLNDAQGTAGIWFSHPNNTLTGNWVNDSQGVGVWNAFAAQSFGLSVNVVGAPNAAPMINWDNNVGACCAAVGVMTAFPVVDERGTTSNNFYPGGVLTAPVKRITTWKNLGGGYFNRVLEPKYEVMSHADNAGQNVFGATQAEGSVSVNALAVAQSLNNANSRYASSYAASFASYHETLNFVDTIIVGYGYIQGIQVTDDQTEIGGGTIRLNDLYLTPLMSFVKNTGFRQINCTTPFRTKSPQLDGHPIVVPSNTSKSRNWSLAGAIRDVNGIFVTAGTHWVYDDPFLTYGATGLTDVYVAGANGKQTPDRYFGVGAPDHAANTYGAYGNNMPLETTRQDSSGNTVGTWAQGDGTVSLGLGHLRHFTAHNGGRYVMRFPGNIATSFVKFYVNGCDLTTDIFLMAVEWSNGVAPRVIQRAYDFTSHDGNRKPAPPSAGDISAGIARELTSTGSFANVVADTTGTIFWQDTTNNRVWFKVRVGSLGLAYNYFPSVSNWSQDFYKPVRIAVIAA